MSLAQSPGRPRARLLVVDDNEDNRYTLVMWLEIEGYSEISVAEDGAAALELLATEEFDLVLLDVMMPKLDGYQVLERLRADDRLLDLPIIMISALNELESVVRCIELGAVDYLAKPFNPVLLKARVGATLEMKKLRDAVRAHTVRLEQELDEARKLQLSMVPTRFPEPTRLFPVDIFAMMEPAREVGGDLYDFFDAQDGTLCFLVGDVAGKGVASALFMARVKNSLRLMTRLVCAARGALADPAAILTAANEELCRENSTLMFVTVFFCMLDLKTGTLLYTNAGHNPPYYLGLGDVRPVEGPKGPPLGIRQAVVYESGTIQLSMGEGLYLYTDGVTEAVNRTEGMFSEERLESVLQRVARAPSVEIVAAVGDAVRTFAEGAPQSDDITALALRLRDRLSS